MTLVIKDGMNVENYNQGVNMAYSNISNVSICHLNKKYFKLDPVRELGYNE